MFIACFNSFSCCINNKQMNIKAVFKGILGIIAYMLIPGIFGGIGAGVYFWLINPQTEAGTILKNGIETTATIIGIDSKVTKTSSSGIKTTSEHYYYLRLSFVNSDGYEIEYKTHNIYPEEFIHKYTIDTGETVQVMYAGTKAVVKGFVPEYQIWLWLFPVVFGAIAAGFLILLVLSFTGKFGDSKP